VLTCFERGLAGEEQKEQVWRGSKDLAVWLKGKGCYLGGYRGYLGALNVDCSQTVQSESEPQMTELEPPRDTSLERTRIIQPAYIHHQKIINHKPMEMPFVFADLQIPLAHQICHTQASLPAS
jgi:hypothetical protein